MSNVGYATLTVIPSMRGFQSALSAGTATHMTAAGKEGGKRFGGAMASGVIAPMKGVLGPLAAVAGGAAVVGVLKDAVGQASDLNEAGTKLQAVFGPATAQVEKFAGAGAKALGQSNLAVKDAVATFGLYGKAAGLAGDANVKFSTQLTTLSTDLASFYNSSPEEAVEAIGAALRGEAEPIRKYGVLLNDATLRQQALRMGLIKTTKDALTPQQKTLAAQAVIMQQTKVAQGDFARTSAGLANQQRILNAQWTDAKAKLGSALLPIVIRTVTALNNGMGPALAFVERNAVRMAPAFSAAGNALKGVFAVVQLFATGDFTGAMGKALGVSDDDPIVGKVLGLRSEVTQLASTVAATLLPALTRLGAFVTATVVPAVMGLATFVAANVLPVLAAWGHILATQVYPMLASIAAFVLGTFVPAVVGIVITVGSRLAPVFAAISQTLQTQVMPALSAALAKFHEYQPTIQRVIMIVTRLVGAVLSLAASILGTVLPPLIRFAGFMAGQFIGSQVRAVGAVVKFIATVIRIGAAVGSAAQRVAAFASDVASRIASVVSAVAAVPGKIRSAFGNAGGILVGAGRAIMDGLYDGLVAGFERVQGMVSGVAGWIQDHKGPISYDRRLLIPHGKAIMAGLNEGLTVGMKPVKRTVSGAAGEIVAAVGAYKTPHSPYGSVPHHARPTYAKGSAPLVGSLTLQSSGSVRSDLQEVEFTMRKIRRGGVHSG